MICPSINNDHNNCTHSRLSLPGIDTEPIPTDRLFFAIFPGTSVAESIERFARRGCSKQRLNGDLLAAARFHVLLHHLGDFVGLPRGILSMAGRAASAVCDETPQFEVALDRAMSFVGRPGRHPFVLCGCDGVVALTAFHKALGGAMAQAGLKLRTSPLHYTPHLTLLYGDRHVAEQTIEPIVWAVREFTLVRSLIGLHRYESLGP
jgi:2'-5' RNA ligase